MSELEKRFRAALRAFAAAQRDIGRFKHVVDENNLDDDAFQLFADRAAPLLASSKRLAETHKADLLSILRELEERRDEREEPRT